MRLKSKYEIGDIPHSEYPRPQFKRDSFLVLNGWWDFAKAKITDTYQGREDINRSTGNKHTNAVIAIPTLPSTDLIPSICLP